MKTLFTLLFAVATFAATATAESTHNGTTSEPKDRPVIGMTMDKAKSYYGAPFTQMTLPHGVRWYYRLKFDEVYGRAMVPFYYSSPDVRWGFIDFGADGRAKAFDWHHAVLRD